MCSAIRQSLMASSASPWWRSWLRRHTDRWVAKPPTPLALALALVARLAFLQILGLTALDLLSDCPVTVYTARPCCGSFFCICARRWDHI